MPLPHNDHLCAARTRKGTPCQNPAMANGRCRMHGGKTPRGTDLPQFKTGRFSKSLPDRLVERYEQTLNDEERHNLADEIALAETKIDDLFAKMSEAGESDKLWKDVETWMARKQRLVEADMRVAQIKQEMVSAEEVMALVAGILDAIRRHVADQATRSALAREIRALGSFARRDDEGSE
jgi:uncharacterized protein YjcR